MRVFKLHKTDSHEYLLTKQKFKGLTQEKMPYAQRFPGDEKNGYAYCPGCGNPIQIIGLYRPIKGDILPYCKHYGNNVPGIGEHNEDLYRNCRYAVHMRGVCPKEERKKNLSEYELTIYETIKQYFDKIVYILKESIGVNITSDMAEHMLRDYIDSQGCMYPFHTVNNAPWMLMYLSDYGLDPYGKCISVNSELYKKLEAIDTVYFEDILIKQDDPEYKKQFAKKYRILKTTRYTQLSVLFFKFERKKKADDIVEEFMTMTLAHRYRSNDDWTVDSEIIIKIDEMWFQKIIHSTKAMQHRKKDLLDIADELMNFR